MLGIRSWLLGVLGLRGMMSIGSRGLGLGGVVVVIVWLAGDGLLWLGLDEDLGDLGDAGGGEVGGKVAVAIAAPEGWHGPILHAMGLTGLDCADGEQGEEEGPGYAQGDGGRAGEVRGGGHGVKVQGSTGVARKR